MVFIRLRDFRVGWRLLAAEPVYSAIAIGGLATGFAACFLLLAFVRYSFDVDRLVPDGRQVYLMKEKLNLLPVPAWSELTAYPLLAAAETSGLTKAATTMRQLDVSIRAGTDVQSLPVTMVDRGFPRVFGVQTLEGDLHAALARPDALALTRGSAQKLFGDGTALGRTLTTGGRTYRVLAIVADVPTASTVVYAALAGPATAILTAAYRTSWKTAWGAEAFKLYVRLKPGADPAALEQALYDASEHSPEAAGAPPDLLQKFGRRGLRELRLTALRDAYFDNDTANRPGSGPHGDRRAVLVLAAAALLILLLALANYVNLATVRTVRRHGEIALRKLLGATPARVAALFLAESLLTALIAATFGVLLTWLLLPVLSDLLERRLDTIVGPGSLAVCACIAVMAGLAGGVHPASVAFRLRPAAGLNSRDGMENIGGIRLRRALTIMQFAAAMMLVGVTLAVAWQTRYAMRADPGFDSAPLLVIDLPQAARPQTPRGAAWRAELARLPGVAGVAAAEDPVGDGFIGNNIEFKRTDGTATYLVRRAVTSDFFALYGLKPLAGRLFDSRIDRDDGGNSGLAVLNGVAARALGFAAPEAALGRDVVYHQDAGPVTLRVIGIAPDIRHDSLRDAPRPIVYLADAGQTKTLTVRSEAGAKGLAALEAAVDASWRRNFPDEIMDMRRAAVALSANYDDDLRLAQLLAAASAVALSIAAFGIYALSAYNVQRRAKEIALRKLHGAGRADIAALLGREFLVLAAVAAMLALPPAAWLVERYLATFVERAPAGAWPLLAAPVLCLLTASAATWRHAHAAMSLAPARVLRN
jgi:cell division protein FtsX